VRSKFIDDKSPTRHTARPRREVFPEPRGLAVDVLFPVKILALSFATCNKIKYANLKDGGHTRDSESQSDFQVLSVSGASNPAEGARLSGFDSAKPQAASEVQPQAQAPRARVELNLHVTAGSCWQ
jgi:hypothetical protein